MKKRLRVKNWKRFSIALLMLLLVIVIAIASIRFGRITHNGDETIQTSSNIEETNKKEKIEEKEETSSMSLVMVGDYLIHSSIYKDASKNAGYNGYDFKPMLTYVKEKVRNYDLAYYNQETVLGGSELGVSDYPNFNSPYEAGDAMLDAGFNLVSLATNHTMDSGSKAVLNSRAYWDKQENVLAVGSYDSFETGDKIQIREKNGITYTMLNYTYGTNGIAVPEGKEYLVNIWPTDLAINDPKIDTKYQEYKERVKEDIEKVRDKVDVLIVAMHWGVEYTHVPTAYQVDEAEFLASQGVDIVIGTHPHVIQPVTWIDDTLVFYSLGNFISAQYQDANYNKMVGLMSSLEITKTKKGEESSIKIDNVENELVYTYYNKSSWRDFKVVPFSNSDISKYLSGYEKVYETYKQVVQKYDKEMYVVPLSEA